jgi:hypothetical protein
MTERIDSLPEKVPDYLTKDRFHPMANMFPLLSEEETDRLAKSIKEVGLLEPIVRYEGMILDGRNRFRACERIVPPYELREGIDIFDLKDVDPFLYVLSKNIERRHLTAEDKRAIIRELLTRYPDHSSRWIAALAKVSHHTVEDERKKEEAKTGPEAKTEKPNDFAKKTKGKDGKERKRPEPKQKDEQAERKKVVAAFKEKWEALDPGQRKSFVRQYKPDLQTIIGEIDAE